jgi:IS5 family transposase
VTQVTRGSRRSLRDGGTTKANSLSSAGTDVALEATHLARMGDDWSLLPRACRMAQRTMRTIRMTLAYAAVYIVAGIGLAAFGLIPPIVATAARSVPDLVFVAKSSRLLRAARTGPVRLPDPDHCGRHPSDGWMAPSVARETASA